MIEFMVISAPRSGSTWAANWLTTDTTLCLHDPLAHTYYTELDFIESSKKLGAACTALIGYKTFLNLHPARKVILHREPEEVNQSLVDIGLTPMGNAYFAALNDISGLHVYWKELFNNPVPIYEFLLQLPFDAERHAILKEMEVQPNFEGLTINKLVTKKYVEDMMGDIRG